MPSHTAFSSATNRQSPKASSPVKTLRQDAFREPASPSRGPVDRNNRRTAQEREIAVHETITRGTFLEDITPVEMARQDEGDDPHDLSFSPKHFPRASMVDNMVRSLDQFSNPSSSSHYNEPTNATSQYNNNSSMVFGRQRGHVHSSSISSDGDAREDRSWLQNSAFTPRPVRRNSNKRFERQKLPSIFGEDEDSTRVKVYESQRATRPPKMAAKKHNRNGKGSKGSASSVVDLSHLAQFQGRLGPAGNRRSRSFDFGSSRPKDLSFNAPDPLDIAAPPVISAGLEAQQSPMLETFQSVLGRRNSTKSSKSVYGKHAKVGTLGTSTIRAVGKEQLPALPSMRNHPVLSSTPSDQKTDQSPASRPGFFRRVFGTTKSSTTTDNMLPQQNSARASPYGRGTPVGEDDTAVSTASARLQKPFRTDSADISVGKENQNLPNTITKKSSTFFRRRKKSISNSAPPPIPLTLNQNLNPKTTQVGQASPVSSLRALMGPYLADEDMPGALVSEEGLGYYTPRGTPQLVDGFAEEQSQRKPTNENTPISLDLRPKLQIPDSKQGSMLRVPHHDSFLADSSSAEELSKKAIRTSPISDRPHADSFNRSPVNSVHRVPSNQSSIANTTSEWPVGPPRQDSWKADKSPLPSPRPATAVLPSAKIRPPLEVTVSEKRIQTATTVSSPKFGKESPVVSPSDVRSASEVSVYKSAPTTPLSVDNNDKIEMPLVHVSHPSISQGHSFAEKAKAQRIYDNEDEEVGPASASAWLAEAGSDRERIRKAYMELFNWTGLTILAAMRDLCDRIALKGETQQVDRMLDAFATRWCECNINHGFKSSDVVHTICYSVLLLNTDLHLADIGQKMTRSQFVRNALPAIKRVVQESDSSSIVRATSPSMRSPPPDSDHTPRRTSIDHDVSPAPPITRPVDRLTREDSTDFESVGDKSGPLVDAPFVGSEKGWEAQIESVLKSFYMSISRQRLPLFGAPAETSYPPIASAGLLSMTSNMLRRTPSNLSKNPPESLRGRIVGESRTLGSRFAAKGRSRVKLNPTPGFGSSRTSLDDQSSNWSPSMSSTWSKASLGKTLTSASVDSFGSEATRPDYQSSIGFANALSQAIIRDDQLDFPLDEGMKSDTLLEDESLGLCGAPWAKEGIVKHKCHLEGVDKRSKDRNWSDCFAVIEKGWMRLFSFSMNAKSLRQKTKNQKAGRVVGGGNWQDNAEEVWKFLLRQTIASSLPPPGYSKARPYVWALSLPTGAVHLFSVGTPDIVKEFVSTANYWSARLSKEPMMGGVSNMEYGWSDAVINRALISSESQPVPTRGYEGRPSTQMSVRSSIDHGTGTVRAKLPGDKVHINDWIPPQQSMMASQLMEVDQLKGLQTYVKNVEEDLQKHNELRAPMLLAFSPRHPNSSKAMGNWEKKSSYLLREIVKFRTYIDNLETAQSAKERVYAMRRQDDENRRQQADTLALGAAMNADVLA